MSRSKLKQKRAIISLLPVKSIANSFVGKFSKTISEQGYEIRDFPWKAFGLRRVNYVIIHWPEHLFVADSRIAAIKLLARIFILRITKVVWGTKLIWVAHNVAPHDEGSSSNSRIRKQFLPLLDGVIYLSAYSRNLINGVYPEIAKRRELVTVHGHYRESAVTRETLSTQPNGKIKLVYFGQIRRYKNIEELIDAVSLIPSAVSLLVAGMVVDQPLSVTLKKRAESAPNVELDFRETPIDDAELEKIIDSADAVVLPYKSILNSGSAILALSRNRPILAPNIGSLPELQDTVGADWVYLYDGDLNQKVFIDFGEWLQRVKRNGRAPLEAYEWSRIGRQLHHYLEALKR